MQSWSAMTSFVACKDCGLLLPLRAPVQAPGVAEELLVACREFAGAHAAHHVVGLQRRNGEMVADRPIWDPMATVRFEVTDGTGSFVVTASRESIEEPRTYRLSAGCLPPAAQEVSIDTADLRRGLDLEFQPHAVRPTKLERLAAALDETVRRLQPQELEIRHDVPEDPSASMARFPDPAFDSVLTACADIFDAWELPRVRRFLLDNRDDDGLLMIRVRRLERHPDA